MKDIILYPLKFIPVYKDYLWGARNLIKYGKKLPDGIVAESWELSCHPDGMSIISNGLYSGRTLESLINEFGGRLVGDTYQKNEKFPLLVKFIDANDRLSVQVHPDDSYALTHEGEYGKNEMWYIIEAKPGAALIYDVRPGVTRESFKNAVTRNKVDECLKILPVKAGDFVNIPAGMIHAIGAGIILAEIQQNSNSTYRLYDYNRTDANGNKRPLHIEKALDVIDFNPAGRKERYEGLKYSIPDAGDLTILVASRYFCVELLNIEGWINQSADGRRFYIYVCIQGKGEIQWGNARMSFQKGETVLIPASLGNYSLNGQMKALKAYIPDLDKDIFERLLNLGFSRQEIIEKISGL